MRYFQIVESEYRDSLEDAIVTLLLAVSVAGIREIETSQLVKDLQQQGFNEIDTSIILPVLNNLQIVSNATTELISIKSDIPSRVSSDDVKSREKRHIDKAAQKQAKKDLGL